MKFEVGVVYETRSVCDHNCIFKAKVVSRTDKTVTVMLDNDIKYPRYSKGEKRFKIKQLLGRSESFAIGSYSMAPIFSADKKVVQ